MIGWFIREIKGINMTLIRKDMRSVIEGEDREAPEGQATLEDLSEDAQNTL